MALSIQQLSDDSKLSHALRFEVLEHLCPPELVSELLSRCHAWGERERSLNQLLVVYYVIALSLFRRLNLAAVLAHLVRGLRWLWSNPLVRLPTAGALVYRRRQLGTPVMRHLFQSVCRPMATEQTTGAFRFGLRLMALDGTLDEVADTEANALYFGRLSSGKPLPVPGRGGHPCHRRCRVRSVSGGRATPRSPAALPRGAAGHARDDGSRHCLSRRAE